MHLHVHWDLHKVTPTAWVADWLTRDLHKVAVQMYFQAFNKLGFVYKVGLPLSLVASLSAYLPLVASLSVFTIASLSMSLSLCVFLSTSLSMCGWTGLKTEMDWL